MKQRKQNISHWYALGLAAVLMVFCLMASTGAAWARYRAQTEGTLTFQTRPPLSFYLGKIVEDTENNTESFEATDQSSWETVDGVTQLHFAIANGTAEDAFEEYDQNISIRLIGSLGVLGQEETAVIQLTAPLTEPEEQEEGTGEDTEEQTLKIEATAVRIAENSPLYSTFGDGWVFYFLDEDGEELLWMLEGGKLSYVDMTMTLENGTLIDTSLLQLQITGELAQD